MLRQLRRRLGEENLLGERSLPSGKSIQANIDNGTNDCYYDLEVVLDDSRKIVHRAVNVCASAKWVIGEAQRLGGVSRGLLGYSAADRGRRRDPESAE